MSDRYPLKGTTFSTTSVDQEVHLLPTFNASLSRPLSVVHIYQPWSSPTPDAQIQEVRATGAIPMIDWACGDTDANIISGADDALISGFARQLARARRAALSALVLRAQLSRREPTMPPASRTSALRDTSKRSATSTISSWPPGHRTWRSSGPSVPRGTDHDWIEYYPGSTYVDWMTADGYVRTSTPTPGVFSQRFARWYQTFADFGKPLMITETAAFSGAQQDILERNTSRGPFSVSASQRDSLLRRPGESAGVSARRGRDAILPVARPQSPSSNRTGLLAAHVSQRLPTTP